MEGKPRRHPSGQAIGQLLEKMNDDDWFPGKICGSGSLGGRPSALNETNKAVIAKSAMALKERGIEPTYPLVIAQCTNAAINPETGDFVNKQAVYDILESKWCDEDPEVPWGHLPRSSKGVLTDEEIEKRLRFGVHMETLNHTADWYFRRTL